MRGTTRMAGTCRKSEIEEDWVPVHWWSSPGETQAIPFEAEKNEDGRPRNQTHVIACPKVGRNRTVAHGQQTTRTSAAACSPHLVVRDGIPCTSCRELQLLVVPPALDVVVEKVAVHRRLNDARQPDQPLPVPRLGVVAIDPVQNVQRPIRAQ